MKIENGIGRALRTNLLASELLRAIADRPATKPIGTCDVCGKVRRVEAVGKNHKACRSCATRKE